MGAAGLRRAPARPGDPSPDALVEVLLDGGAHVPARPWVDAPEVAGLRLSDARALPALALDGSQGGWPRTLARAGFAQVRTGAVTQEGADYLADIGFVAVRRLVVLDREIGPLRSVKAPGGERGSMRPSTGRGARILSEAATLDDTAFGPVWRMVERDIRDALDATPSARLRFHRGPDGALVAYCITGRGANQGFLQRLAVHPSAKRLGLGRSLVVDGLRWCRRGAAPVVYVNTTDDNDAALGLYHSLGFHQRDEYLHVMQAPLAP